MSTSIESGISSAEHQHLDRVGDDVDRAAALDAGRLLGVLTCTGMRTRILAPSPSRMKSTWTGSVLHRIELEVARDHAVLRAIDLEIVDRGEEVAGIDALLEFVVIERDRRAGALLSP